MPGTETPAGELVVDGAPGYTITGDGAGAAAGAAAGTICEPAAPGAGGVVVTGCGKTNTGPRFSGETGAVAPPGPR